MQTIGKFNLNSTLQRTGNQCKDHKTRVIWSRLCTPIRSLVTAFWTNCNWDKAVWLIPSIKWVTVIKFRSNKSINHFLKVFKRNKLLNFRQESPLKKGLFDHRIYLPIKLQMFIKHNTQIFYTLLNTWGPPTKIWIGTVRESEGPNTMISVLFSLKFRKFSANHAFHIFQTGQESIQSIWISLYRQINLCIISITVEWQSIFSKDGT